MVIDPRRVLEFYDTKHPKSEWGDLGSPISAITGLVGEDLVLGLLLHSLEKERFGNLAIDWRCKGKEQKGAWLDAWVSADGVCYATEVKNWCASAIGGIPIKEDESNLVNASIDNLNRYLRESPKKVWKVLHYEKMESPSECDSRKARPLLAFWSPVAREGVKTPKPLFKCPIEEYRSIIEDAEIPIPEGLKSVSVFSASLYLRGLRRREKIRVYMPRVVQRLKKIEGFLRMSDFGNRAFT